MKVAVVTPYYDEPLDILVRCKKSVDNQTYTNIKQIFVADGKPNDWVSTWKDTTHIILSCSHRDAGATPRAIGAISAFSQGFDAVSFLDADNTYDHIHVETMIKGCQENACDLVSATRNIYSHFNNNLLYTDTIESNGKEFSDTNCLFVTKNLMPLMTHWITSKDLYLAGDRVFWNLIVDSKDIKRMHCTMPTVNYYTKWAWHHQHAKVDIPDDSVWMKIENNKVTTHKHKEK